MCAAHDMSRPLAMMRGFGLYIEPDLCRSIGMIFYPESQEEFELVKNMHTNNIKKNFIDPAYKDLDKIKREIPEHILEKGALQPFRIECSAVMRNGLAEEMFPKIFLSKDQDGLIDMDNLEPFKPGIFKVGKLVLFAHRYFRRNLHIVNSYCDRFMDILQGPKVGTKAKVKIALDPDMVGLAESYREKLEFEYWWGPKFDDDLKNIPYGVTVHVEPDEYKKNLSGVEKTEFYWKELGGEKSFECEELGLYSNLDIAETPYGCRYVHTMLENQQNSLKHIDGALRCYSEKVIASRRQAEINSFGRSSQYIKLWRWTEKSMS